MVCPGATAASGEGEDRRAIARDVVRLVHAVDPAATGIAAAERAEMEPRDVVVGDSRAKATATRGTRHRRTVAVANRQGPLELGFGRVNHRRDLPFQFAGDDETAPDSAVGG